MLSVFSVPRGVLGSPPVGRRDAGGGYREAERVFYALSAWAGSIPPQAIPPGMEGLEPIQTVPCPHPRPPPSHPSVTTVGK